MLGLSPNVCGSAGARGWGQPCLLPKAASSPEHGVQPGGVWAQGDPGLEWAMIREGSLGLIGNGGDLGRCLLQSFIVSLASELAYCFLLKLEEVSATCGIQADPQVLHDLRQLSWKSQGRRVGSCSRKNTGVIWDLWGFQNKWHIEALGDWKKSPQRTSRATSAQSQRTLVPQTNDRNRLETSVGIGEGGKQLVAWRVPCGLGGPWLGDSLLLPRRAAAHLTPGPSRDGGLSGP